MEETNQTLQYYDVHAAAFVGETAGADMSFAHEKFLHAVKEPPAKILDLGCGSGRDTLFFQGRGYDVDAVDGSPGMCEEARRQTGVNARCQLFSEINAAEDYDAVWACASLLHVPSAELKKDILPRTIRALKTDGVFYVSLKYGEGEQYEKGRFFSRWNEVSFHELIAEAPVEVIDEWVSEDVRPERRAEKWLNVLLRKRSAND